MNTEGLRGDGEVGSVAELVIPRIRGLFVYELVPRGWVGGRPPSLPFCLCSTFRLSQESWKKLQRSRSPEKCAAGEIRNLGGDRPHAVHTTIVGFHSITGSTTAWVHSTIEGVHSTTHSTLGMEVMISPRNSDGVGVMLTGRS